MKTQTVTIFTFLLFLLPLSPAYAQGFRDAEPLPSDKVPGEARIALVIGNQQYTHLTKLKNPVNDAEDMTKALQQRGFAVITGTNLTAEQMEAAITTFTNRIGAGSIALFYYAGHGVGHQGDNYLIPVDANITSRAQIAFRSVNAREVLFRIEEKNAHFSMIFLDACRDSPFRGFRSSSGGWATMQGDGGALIAYGTAPGKQASDNQSGNNGLFTQALLTYMHEPGLEVMELLRRVSGDVQQFSNRQQRPWLASSYTGAFFFTPKIENPQPVEISHKDEIKRLHKKASRSWKNLKYNESILYLLEAYILNENDTSTLDALGNAYYGKGANNQKALEYFEKLIELDPTWKYADARVKYCIVYFKMNYRLDAECRANLTQYLNQFNSTGLFISEAEYLLAVINNPIETQLVRTKNHFDGISSIELLTSQMNVIYYWATWCAPCIDELTNVFGFAEQHPDVKLMLVSVDSIEEAAIVDKISNSKFAPFIPLKLQNVRFLHDPNQHFVKRFFSDKSNDHNVFPKNLFLNYDNIVWQYTGRLANDWDTLVPADLWK